METTQVAKKTHALSSDLGAELEHVRSEIMVLLSSLNVSQTARNAVNSLINAAYHRGQCVGLEYASETVEDVFKMPLPVDTFTLPPASA
jgi:hypothetical protein